MDSQWLILVATDDAEESARRLASDSGHDSVRIQRIDARLGGNLGKLWLEHRAVPRSAERWGADLLHVPYFGPPARCEMPLVVTVHDLIMMRLPEHRGGRLVRMYTKLAARGTRRARLILADSNATRDDVVDLLRISSSLVRTVYLGAGRPVKQQNDPAAIRRRYGIPVDHDFIFYLGGFDFRKNVPALLSAFAGTTIEGPLVLGGRVPEPGGLFPDIRERIRELGIENRVILTGYIAEEDKPILYRAARLVVYPSLYEGFGLPVLEAMSVGAAVLSSNRSSLPEIYGDAAAGVDPLDGDELRRHLQDLFFDHNRLEQLRAAGLRRAEEFSWKRCASETLRAYRDAAG